MLDYLVKHAVDNVWCSPEQDRQAIIQPKRLSRRLGALSHQTVMWERVLLPTKTDYYHVFQIGHVYPKLLGLVPVTNSWMKLSDVINTTTLMAEIYFANGVVLPRTECWLRYDRHKNLILAIEDTRIFPELRDTGIYFRVYSNAFFESYRANAEEEGTFVEGLTVSTEADVLNLQQKFHLAMAKPGEALAYHNGWLVGDLRPARIALGDKIEYVYDSSVYRVVDFAIADLTTFESTLDNKRKYLLNYGLFNNTSIDFEDDIDFYLYKRETDGRMRGVYYHRNRKDAIRMLSHKDYAVPVSTVDAFQQTHSDVWSDMNTLTIRLYVRKAGFERPLVQEHHRLFELYRLSPEDVRGALAGIDSVVDVWKAENLENSPYVKLMKATNNDIDPLLVQQAYGYNAVSRLVGDTPQLTRETDSGPVADLLPGHQVETTMYEYDTQGKLLGYYYHPVGLIYRCVHPQTKMIEAVVGQVGEELDVVFGNTLVNTDSKYNYRAYVSTRLGETLVWDWVDVSNSELISVGSNQIGFDINPATDYPAVISDKRFIGYQITVPIANGVLKFSVNSFETHLGETERRLSTIPPRRIDVWVNKHPLIEGLDYYVQWPEVVVVNKQYLTAGEDQVIDIRCQGFCRSEMTPDAPREFGFVEHGYLSANRRYNVRDDKVLSMIVGGKLVDRNQLEFAEDSSGIIVNNVANGTPYSLRETIVPMRGETYLDTYAFRARSQEVDLAIEDYLTLKYPEPVIPGPSPITDLYMVYSPFMSRIINDLQEGYIDEGPLTRQYSNADVYAWANEYEHLLDYDPLKKNVDERYVKVHPHRYLNTVALSIYQYNFIQRINQLYFDSKLPLSQFIEVTLPQTQE
jgi:hypothetical protein